MKRVILIIFFVILIPTISRASNTQETEEGANVQIWDKCNGGQQRFFITYIGNGYYTIRNVNSGMMIDVYGAGITQGTNVHQWTYNNTDAQKWKFERNADNSFTIISKCNNLYLNVKNSRNSNGANIEVNSQKQFFNFNKISTVKGTKTVEDGIYTISSLLDKNKVIDISAASKYSGANVHIWEELNVPQQKFYIKYGGDGYYTITNMNSGKVLDVQWGKTEIRTNVWQYENNGTDAQKWVISETKDGNYNIISKVSGIYLEVSDNRALNGTNVHINYGSGTNNQKFMFNKVDVYNKPIDDGVFEVTSKLASNMVLDVSGASEAENANIQIWADANEKQQKFKFEYAGNGYYKISCVKSEKALTVLKNDNVVQTTYKGNSNQLWRLEKLQGNEFNIVSKYNEKCLNVYWGRSENGTNVDVFEKNNTTSQIFILENKIYGIDVSHWQGVIDFKSLKNSQKIDFMIIRAGQGTNIIDRQFERNYREAKNNNIPLGVYLYAKAQNVQEAREEAYHFLDLIKGKSFELPVYYDVEAHENLDADTIMQICREFYKIVKSAGYKPGIYASKYYLLYKMKPEQIPSDCSIWVASYGNDDGAIPKDTYKYYGRYDIWQYTSTGWIVGINGDVDFSVGYRLP